MKASILDAIKQGQWDYEPNLAAKREYASTTALPGSDAKLKILADRIAEGLPLWHPDDRITYDNSDIFD